MPLAAAVELLRARQGNAHQIAVVPVRVEGVAFKVRFDRLNTCFRMLTQLKPVVCHTSPSSQSALLALAFLSGRFVQNRRVDRQIAVKLSS
ncbi:hypothetical protein D3C86_1929670 [compost metagenome]